MLYDFDDTINFKSAWCRKQARLLRQLNCAEEEPVNTLQEMARRDYRTAESATIKLMEHILYVSIAPNNDAKIHWLGEMENFRKLLREGLDISENNKKGNTNLKNKLVENW